MKLPAQEMSRCLETRSIRLSTNHKATRQSRILTTAKGDLIWDPGLFCNCVDFPKDTMGLLANIRNILISLISVKPKGPYAKTVSLALFTPFGLCYCSPSGQKEGHSRYCLRKTKIRLTTVNGSDAAIFNARGLEKLLHKNMLTTAHIDVPKLIICDLISPYKVLSQTTCLTQTLNLMC